VCSLATFSVKRTGTSTDRHFDQTRQVLSQAHGTTSKWGTTNRRWFWVKIEQLQGHEGRARELRQIFEKSGYTGYLGKDVKDNDAAGDPYEAAADYAMLGEKDAALAALEKAFVSREGIVDIYVNPRFDNLRSDPRFADLLRRIGFPQ
jgi:hypothetical protein